MILHYAIVGKLYCQLTEAMSSLHSVEMTLHQIEHGQLFLEKLDPQMPANPNTSNYDNMPKTAGEALLCLHQLFIKYSAKQRMLRKEVDKRRKLLQSAVRRVRSRNAQPLRQLPPNVVVVKSKPDF